MKRIVTIGALLITSNIIFGKTLDLPGIHVTGGTYQDIVINNKIIFNGNGPNCKIRYEAIKKILQQFKRPITVLDIGTGEGYMSFRIAYEFDSTCVMIADPNHESRILPQLCKLNTELDNIILLYKRVSAQELENLSKCEHFDVVIALNVLHHFPKNLWKKAANAIMNLGDCVIIETPPVEDKRSCGRDTLPGIINFIKQNKGIEIARVERRHTTRGTFSKTYALEGTNENSSDTLKKKGINLTTFNALDGIYPNINTIKDLISQTEEKMGVQLFPENIILQGNSISLANENNLLLQ